MISAIGDFVDERGRIRNKTRRFNFCKTVRWAIKIYLGDQVEVIGSRLSQRMVHVLSESREQFGNEMGSQMSSLKDVQRDFQRCGQYGACFGE